MGAEGAVNVVFRKEIEKAADPAAKRAELIDEYQEKFSTPYAAAERGFIDDVIEPAETRPAPDPVAPHALDEARERPGPQAREHPALAMDGPSAASSSPTGSRPRRSARSSPPSSATSCRRARSRPRGCSRAGSTRPASARCRRGALARAVGRSGRCSRAAASRRVARAAATSARWPSRPSSHCPNCLAEYRARVRHVRRLRGGARAGAGAGDRGARSGADDEAPPTPQPRIATSVPVVLVDAPPARRRSSSRAGCRRKDWSRPPTSRRSMSAYGGALPDVPDDPRLGAGVAAGAGAE